MLKTYRCIKTVKAAKIVGAEYQQPVTDNKDGTFTTGDAVLILTLEGGTAHTLPGAWWEKHKDVLEKGGYLVEYADGYFSYSPAAAFEAGYLEVAPVSADEAPLFVPLQDEAMFVSSLNKAVPVPPGHVYFIKNFADPTTFQRLNFICKIPAEGGEPGSLFTLFDGVTNEALLDVLRHRVGILDSKFPCAENKQALGFIVEARNWLLERTRRRKARAVEGKALA